MGFKKGHKQFNTGRTHFKKGLIPWNKKDKFVKSCLRCGKEMQLWPSLAKIVNHCSRSCGHKGKIAWNKGLIGYMAGKNHHWYGSNKSGENNPTWKGGWQFWKKKDERGDSGYQAWAMQVKKRDNFECKINDGNCDGNLEVHHILNWSKFPKLRYQINNGITLCHAHHPRGRAKETKLIPIFQGLILKSDALF